MTLDDLWEDLFGCDPTLPEERVMKGLAKRFGPADDAVLVAAIVVHFVTQELLLDEGSPIRIAARAGRALEQLEARLTELNRIARHLDAHLSEMRTEVRSTRAVLDDARTLGKQRKIPPPVLQMDPNTGSPYYRHTLAPNALRRFALVTFVSVFAGCLVFNIGFWIVSAIS